MLISSARLRSQVVHFEQILADARKTAEYESVLRVIFYPIATPKRIGRLLIYGKSLQRALKMMKWRIWLLIVFWCQNKVEKENCFSSDHWHYRSLVMKQKYVSFFSAHAR